VGEKDNLVYYAILQREIVDMLKTGYTSFVVEYDQKSSSSTLLGLLLQNKDLCIATGLTSGEMTRQLSVIAKLKDHVQKTLHSESGISK